MSRYAVMDIESISLDKTRVHPLIGRFSRIHNCRRKLAIELWNEQSLVLEAVPCVDYKSLSESERYTFGYSRKRFHRLTYQPFMSSLKCMDVAGVSSIFMTTVFGKFTTKEETWNETCVMKLTLIVRIWRSSEFQRRPVTCITIRGPKCLFTIVK